MNALPLRATQRLQFHKGFTLDDAVPLVPYFAQLGISHLYASPLLSARAGSMHGYDVVDPTRVNPELGGEAALRRLVAELREHDMGLILDIVSNHMAVGGADNPWWLDLLEWGRLSPYSEFFDIQWHSPDPLLKGHVVTVFIMPRTLEELEQRLRGRATDDEDQIQRRMKVASAEMQQHELYDHTILSGSRGEDFQALQQIYFAEKAKLAD